MKDIRVVHDKTGTYSDWYDSDFVIEPWLTKYWHYYFEGKREPHYPVPATMTNAVIAQGYPNDYFSDGLLLLIHELTH